MSLPYEYRDYPLAIFMGFAFVVGGVMTFCRRAFAVGRDHIGERLLLDAELSGSGIVDGMPASGTSGIQSEMRQQPFPCATSRTTSVRELWDTVEAAQGRANTDGRRQPRVCLPAD